LLVRRFAQNLRASEPTGSRDHERDANRAKAKHDAEDSGAIVLTMVYLEIEAVRKKGGSGPFPTSGRKTSPTAGLCHQEVANQWLGGPAVHWTFAGLV
jgi:hypothetical protein